MTKLADMSLTKAERKEATGSTPYKAPEYSYGLCLRLDNAALEKLGIDELPEVGAKMAIEAIGTVTSVSSHESANRDDRTVEIQIEKLGLEDDEDDSEDSPLERIVKRRA